MWIYSITFFSIQRAYYVRLVMQIWVRLSTRMEKVVNSNKEKFAMQRTYRGIMLQGDQIIIARTWWCSWVVGYKNTIIVIIVFKVIQQRNTHSMIWRLYYSFDINTKTLERYSLIICSDRFLSFDMKLLPQHVLKLPNPHQLLWSLSALPLHC